MTVKKGKERTSREKLLKIDSEFYTKLNRDRNKQEKEVKETKTQTAVINQGLEEITRDEIKKVNNQIVVEAIRFEGKRILKSIKKLFNFYNATLPTFRCISVAKSKVILNI